MIVNQCCAFIQGLKMLPLIQVAHVVSNVWQKTCWEKPGALPNRKEYLWLIIRSASISFYVVYSNLRRLREPLAPDSLAHTYIVSYAYATVVRISNVWRWLSAIGLDVHKKLIRQLSVELHCQSHGSKRYLQQLRRQQQTIVILQRIQVKLCPRRKFSCSSTVAGK